MRGLETNHVISGPMRGLEENAHVLDIRQTDRYVDSMTDPAKMAVPVKT